MNITKIISKTFDSRLKQIDLYASQASEIQHRVLSRLVNQAAQTEWGKKYDYASIRSYEDFRNRLPIQTYEEIKPYVERLRAGEQNLLWPSEIRWFAKSSGTTNDKSKFLPVSKEALEDIHYRGGKDAAALYFRINPDSHFFSGKGLILGGSHSPNLNSNHSLVGDLSAILIQNVNPFHSCAEQENRFDERMGDQDRSDSQQYYSGQCDQFVRCTLMDAGTYQAYSRKDRQTNSGGSVAESGSILPRRSGFHPLS